MTKNINKNLKICDFNKVQFANGLRIVVVGTSCSGKSTLARKIAQSLSISDIELDHLHWEKNWTPAPFEIFEERVRTAISENKSWVVHGNYGKVRDMIWKQANVVIWLDYSFSVTFFRALKRSFSRIFFRVPICNGNIETFDRTFLSRDSILLWVLQTYSRRRREYPELLNATEYKHLIKLRFKHPRDAEFFLMNELENFNFKSKEASFEI